MAPTRQELVELTGDDELLFADGFDDAILGVGGRCGRPPVVVYDRDRCIQILVDRDGMTLDEAQECFAFNTEGAWVGDRTPLFLERPG
jgi:hypothetical protein